MTEYHKENETHVHVLFKKTHKVKFYPIADNFTQVLLVMLVTNITSGNCTPHGWL